jgi:hypothetical protein
MSKEEGGLSGLQAFKSRRKILLQARDIFDLEIGHWKSLVGYLEISWRLWGKEQGQSQGQGESKALNDDPQL